MNDLNKLVTTKMVLNDECSVIDRKGQCLNKKLHGDLCHIHYKKIIGVIVINPSAFKSSLDETRYEVNEQHQEGLCRIKELGKECQGESKTRGLCSRHYFTFKDKEAADKFGLPMRKKFSERNFSHNPDAEEGLCCAREDGIVCQGEAGSRGLCSSHYSVMYHHGVAHLYGLPIPKKFLEIDYEINHLAGEDLCRIIEDGRICDRDAMTRGLCDHHYPRLHNNGFVDKYGRPKKTIKFDASRYKLLSNVQKGVCRIEDDGKPCLTWVRKRGLCGYHYQIFQEEGDLKYYTFTLREQYLRTNYEINDKVKKGCCRIVEDGWDCELEVSIRGLCKSHYDIFFYNSVREKYALVKEINDKKVIKG